MTGARSEKGARALRDAVRRLLVAHGTFDELRRPCGTPLATPHAWALLELRHGASVTVSGLAERLNIDRTNVSRLCARMASLGEVELRAHPEDGRARLVCLTAKGERVAAEIDRASAEHFAGVLGHLSQNPRSLIDAIEALSRAMSEASCKENPR